MNRLPVRSPYGRLWSLQRAVDRLFDDAANRVSAEAAEGQPALDMFETEDAVVVNAAVPGFGPDDINVSITGNTLTIKGQVTAEQNQEEHDYIFRERHLTSFSRMLTLPHEVGAEATAQFENGVLTLTLPKPEEVKPKTIQVKVK